MSSYCLKCKKFTDSKGSEPFTAKNGRPMLKSTCADCGGKKCCIVKKVEHCQAECVAESEEKVSPVKVKAAKKSKKVKALVVEEPSEEMEE